MLHLPYVDGHDQALGQGFNASLPYENGIIRVHGQQSNNMHIEKSAHQPKSWTVYDNPQRRAPKVLFIAIRIQRARSHQTLYSALATRQKQRLVWACVYPETTAPHEELELDRCQNQTR